MEFSNCGVGLITSLAGESSHEVLQKGILGLKNVEHRGGSSHSGRLGDGAGVTTEIPYELLDIDSRLAVGTIFAPKDEIRFKKSIEIFEKTFEHFDLIIEGYREVPFRRDVLTQKALDIMPRIVQVFIKRPDFCRTLASFDELLYTAKQLVRTKERKAGIQDEFFFTSLSARTIIYKALSTSVQLEKFYPDLTNPQFRTRFVLFHRRFSTNTLSSWDKVQPFRMIAHNGEINTIEGNRAAALSRESALGLRQDQILTRTGASDSANLNDMIEALKYRSTMPFLKDILSIMIPPAQGEKSKYFKFWSRAMEPWDGPALVVYCDGKKIGARLDRSGFRPCRWTQTEKFFALCSETGAFGFGVSEIEKQGVLHAGRTVNIHVFKGDIDFFNPDELGAYKNFEFDARLTLLPYREPKVKESRYLGKLNSFYYTREDLYKELYPMIESGKGPIGSMGDTATLPVLSSIHRSIYDYFFQDFAQVTNPPLDYIREKMVTSLAVYLGRKPNIFSPKEMIPPWPAFELEGPVLGHGQMEALLEEDHVEVIDICFERSYSVEAFVSRIDDCVQQAIKSTENGKSIIVLSDRAASYERPGIPSIIVMRAVQLGLNKHGIRLKISLIVDSGEIRNAHQLAVLISFGASAICPYIALDIARYSPEVKLEKEMNSNEKEQRLIFAMNEGLLKIMAKRGISVLRSYQGSELFTIMGISEEVQAKLFKKHKLTIGGLGFQGIVTEILERTEKTKDGKLPNNFIYKEHASGKLGEKHSLTTKKTKLLHSLLKEDFGGVESLGWQKFKNEIYKDPINIRDFFILKKAETTLDSVQSRQDILSTIGSGAMSYGSISAEAQRDIFLAFDEIDGRSNSGEGGENPYYFSEGITAKIKQIASGRFGVTAEYIILAHEVQIKMAQGAKPGEGGQLMGIKVDEEIARARYSTPGMSLISPPPHHDIYSIEDLKQLIYELKQLKEGLKVSVKLVSGKNIGAIALGVVKAGADIIHISGGNGGTGAANLMSMKHAGLPWEIGLLEAHKHLSDAQMRSKVLLRIDGGLFTGLDIIIGAIYGAEEFDFGKMLLVAQGCIFARVCEKNICPAGIATQDPKFKSRYKGRVDEIVKFLKYIAEDVRSYLSYIGVSSLGELVGRVDLLELNPKHKKLTQQSNINLDYFLSKISKKHFVETEQQVDFEMNELNKRILNDYNKTKNLKAHYLITSTDRAVMANLNGHLAMQVAEKRKTLGYQNQIVKQESEVDITFEGSAGQGFAIFTVEGVNIKLFGEANDSVAKGMSGGKITIMPAVGSKIDGSKSLLIGNTCLYGATGGELYLYGMAADRFCVRNSGALAISEGVGLHACEYMTNGSVFILGKTLQNIGAGMTGGVIYTLKENEKNINKDFIESTSLDKGDRLFFKETMKSYSQETCSITARSILGKFDEKIEEFIKLIPLRVY